MAGGDGIAKQRFLVRPSINSLVQVKEQLGSTLCWMQRFSSSSCSSNVVLRKWSLWYESVINKTITRQSLKRYGYQIVHVKHCAQLVGIQKVENKCSAKEITLWLLYAGESPRSCKSDGIRYVVDLMKMGVDDAIITLHRLCREFEIRSLGELIEGCLKLEPGKWEWIIKFHCIMFEWLEHQESLCQERIFPCTNFWGW